MTKSPPLLHPRHAAAPRLETGRLILRGFRPEDFEASSALWAEPAVYKHIMGRPSTPEECWFRLLRSVGHWLWFGHGYWAVEEKTTGCLVGEVGFADFHRAMDPPLGDRAEMGWVLSERYHGKGLAREATEAVLAWAQTEKPQLQMACIIAPENEASIRLAQWLGFRQVRETLYNGDRTLVFHR
mgnify:CR=1 FL=1